MTLHVFLTANLAGDLDALPRLYTLLAILRSGLDAPATLIDLGGACHPAQWICQATENRAPYVVMDAMGYHQAVSSILDEENRQKLGAMVQMEIVFPADLPLQVGEWHLMPHSTTSTTPTAALKGRLCRVQLPPTHTIDHLQLEDDGQASIDRHPVPHATLPDPTIAGTVEFVKREVRYYQSKKGQPDATD
jgi:hypothetical protein